MTDLLEGRGAWTVVGKDNESKYYCYRKPFDDQRDGDAPGVDLDHLAVHYAVLAIQIRLRSLGYTNPRGDLKVDGQFGPRTMLAVKWFQDNAGLGSDGVVGMLTAQQMWRPVVRSIGMKSASRPDLLWGMTSQESLFDPGAVSGRYQPDKGPDFGLCQINLRSNPSVSLIQAFTPRYALKWSADRLGGALEAYDGKGPTLQTACAVAHHNSPQQAGEWFLTGAPPSEQIADYVRRVLERAATFGVEE